MTRNVTMTIRKPNGDLWASAAVTFDLLTKLTTRSTDSIFQYQVTVTTDVNGQATAALETPAEGDGAWLWRCTPPDENWFDFALEYGASALDLSTIIAAISLANIAPSAVAALLAAYLPLSGGTLTGNIAFSGAQTVDGVDVSALNTTVSGHTGASTGVHGITDTAVLATTGANTFTAEQTFADQLLTRPVIKDYGEAVNAIGGTGGGTQDIDLTLGNVVSATVDTSANTFTFSNPSASGTACSFTLFLTNGGSQTVNWPASVDWAGGTAPTLTASGVDILTFATLDGGTIWYGFAAGLDMQ